MRRSRHTRSSSCVMPALVVTLALAAAVVHAADRYVSPHGRDAWPYTNWLDAATSLQPALDAAAPEDIVWVTNGTYYITPTLAITQAITVASMNGAAETVLAASTASLFSP